MDRRLKGKVAFVTGAASGIGEATAKRLARGGVAIGIVDLDAAGIERVAGEITAAGGRAIGVSADVSDADQVEAAIARVVEAFGGLNLGVNNAGIACPRSPMAEMPLEVWNRVIGVHTTGIFNCMRFQIPHMLAAGGGAIVNTASVYGYRALPQSAAFTASKAGILGVSKVAAVDYATQNIRINVIVPGVIKTPLLGNSPDGAARIAQAIPMGRMGAPEEMASAIEFLLSDDASYITGTELIVDGGFLS